MSSFFEVLKKYSFLPEWLSVVGVLVVVVSASSFISAVNERTIKNEEKILENKLDIKEIQTTQSEMLQTLSRIDERTKFLVDEHKAEKSGK